MLRASGGGVKDHNMIVLTRQIESGWKHFQARFSEWQNAAILFSLGLYLNLHLDMLTNPAAGDIFKGFVAVMGAPSWALVGILVGGSRLAALYVNGAHTRTPLVRLVTAFFSAGVFTQIANAFAGASSPNFGVIVFSYLVLADLYSAFRASADLTFVSKTLETKDSSESARVVQFSKRA